MPCMRFLLDLAQPMSHWGICAGMAPAVQPSLGDSGCYDIVGCNAVPERRSSLIAFSETGTDILEFFAIGTSSALYTITSYIM